MGTQSSLFVQVKPTVADYCALRRALKYIDPPSRWYQVLWAGLLLSYGCTLAAVAALFAKTIQGPVWLVVLLAYVPAAYAYSALQTALEPILYRALLDPDGTFLSGYVVHAETDGLRVQGSWGCSFYRWSALRGIEESQLHIFAVVDRAWAITIPKQNFASGGQAWQFVERLKSHLADARSNL